MQIFLYFEGYLKCFGILRKFCDIYKCLGLFFIFNSMMQFFKEGFNFILCQLSSSAVSALINRQQERRQR